MRSTRALGGSNDTVWCWGANSRGQLGNGTLVGHYAAAPVVNL